MPDFSFCMFHLVIWLKSGSVNKIAASNSYGHFNLHYMSLQIL